MMMQKHNFVLKLIYFDRLGEKFSFDGAKHETLTLCDQLPLFNPFNIFNFPPSYLRLVFLDDLIMIFYLLSIFNRLPPVCHSYILNFLAT